MSRRLAWRIEAVGLDAFTVLVRLLPIDWASAAGGWLMRTLGPLTPAHATVMRNLEIAFPDAGEPWRRRLASDQWENVGRVFAEFPIIDRIFGDLDRIQIVNGERLAEIDRDREAVVFVSGHLSNWEMMPAAIVRSGVDCLMTYRPTNNPYVDRRIREGRARYGVQLFAPKGESARDLLEALGKGQSVALMNDQKFNEGIAVPFFGEPAMTAPGPTRMALTKNTVLQPMTVRRLKGARFEVVVHEPIRLERTGQRVDDVERGVQRINAWLEDVIRAGPTEWFWPHRRWPKEVYTARTVTVETPNVGPRVWLIRLLVGLGLLIAVGVIVFHNDIVRWTLDPKVPFQTYEPPAAPNYAMPSAWALLGRVGESDAGADVFFIHPTTYDGGREWNAPLDHKAANALLTRAMLPNYVGPFLRSGRVFAPKYRQASLYTRFTRRDDARDARAFAYRDIETAFNVWLTNHDRGGPFVVVGVEQGGELAARLLSQRIATDPALRARMAAAYLVDVVAPAADYAASAPFPACANRRQAGCVVAWAQVRVGADEEGRYRLDRALVWDVRGRLVPLEGRAAICVNPVQGAVNARTTEREHQGGANATGLEWGARPAFLTRQISAQCRNGILYYTPPSSDAFKPTGSWADRRKAPPYNLFYADLEVDVDARLAAWRVSPRRVGPPASRTTPPASGSPVPAR